MRSRIDLVDVPSTGVPDDSYHYNPPSQYNFVRALHDRLGGLEDVEKWRAPTIPSQFEIHLAPTDKREACNYRCAVCAGQNTTLEVADWDETMLGLLHNLQGVVPYNIFGGNYTEPMLNERFADFLEITKMYGGHFGVHTNGSQIPLLAYRGDIDRVLSLSGVDAEDYISVSVYGGNRDSYAKFTGTHPDQGYFEAMVEGIKILGERRKMLDSKVSVRLSYLGSGVNLNEDEVGYMVALAEKAEVDSMRVSIAFAPYGVDFNNLEAYSKWEDRAEARLLKWLPRYLSRGDQKPNIFYRPVAFQKPHLFDPIEKCYYGYYQITAGADGYWYRCSTVTTSEPHRLGPITDNVDDFMHVLELNQDPDFRAKETCMDCNWRCNQMGIQINRYFNLDGNDPLIHFE